MIQSRSLVVLFVVAVTVAGVVGVGGVAAQEDGDSPPVVPAGYHGEIEINGDDPGDLEGVTVEAVTGSDEDSLSVTSDGSFGGPEGGDEKLLVEGETDEEVAFYVDGESFERTQATVVSPEDGVQWESGDVRSVQLTVDVEITEQDGVSATEPVDESGQATVELPQEASVEEVTVELPEDIGATEVTVEEAEEPTGDAPEPDEEVAAYVDISADTDVDAEAEIEVSVSDSILEGVEDPVLLHYIDGNWEELETTVDGSTLSATASGLSPFAVAEARDDDSSGTGGGSEETDDTGGGGGGGGGAGVSDGVTVTDLDPQSVEVTQRETITVSATLENTDALDATQEIELRIDGETIATQEVTLEGDEQTTVEFAGVGTERLEAGEHEHTVETDDDSVSGTLTIIAPSDDADNDNVPGDETESETDGNNGADSETDGDDTADDDSESDTGSGPTEEPAELPGFGAGVALVALLAAAFVAVRRADGN